MWCNGRKLVYISTADFLWQDKLEASGHKRYIKSGFWPVVSFSCGIGCPLPRSEILFEVFICIWAPALIDTQSHFFDVSSVFMCYLKISATALCLSRSDILCDSVLWFLICATIVAALSSSVWFLYFYMWWCLCMACTTCHKLYCKDSVVYETLSLQKAE